MLAWPSCAWRGPEELGSVATILGEPYGQVRGDVTERLSADIPSMPSYTCVLRAYDYRRSFDEKLYQPVLDCLKAAVARDPDYAAAWAMLGWLQLDAARFHLFPAGAGGDAQSGDRLRLRHVDLEEEPPGLQALSASLYYAGRYEDRWRCKRGALALNENSPDTLAQLGWRLAALRRVR